MNQVTFQIDYIQFLSPDSKLTTNKLPALVNDHESLIALYRTMVLARRFDQKAIALQRTGKMGTYASIHGQEAIGTAIGHAMESADVLAPFYRDYAAQIQRGVTMSEIYQYWGGDERGSCYKENKHDLPICVPIATQCLHATGIAFAFKYKKVNQAVVTCIGDGGTSEGDFYEALNIAGAWRLPVVFVINNNQWAISVPRQAQTACETLAQKAIAAGIKGLQVDGNDVIGMRHVMGEALHKARTGGGPTLIEAMTYRLCDHTTADDATRYRGEKEVDLAHKLEPIARLQKFLVHEKKIWDDQKEQALQQEVEQDIAQAVDTYLSQPPPQPQDMFDYLYDELPEALHKQRQEVMENI